MGLELCGSDLVETTYDDDENLAFWKYGNIIIKYITFIQYATSDVRTSTSARRS